MIDEARLEKVARELCQAAGKDPDAKMRLGEPIAFAQGDCTIVKPLIVPAWKAYCREAQRLAMSDDEHAEAGEEQRAGKRRVRFRRTRRSARVLRVVLRRRQRQVLQLRQRLKRRLSETCGGVLDCLPKIRADSRSLPGDRI